MNKALDNEARYRIDQGLGPLAKGQCQAWVRQCYEVVYGDRYERYHLGTARLAGQQWAADAKAGHLPEGVVVVRNPTPEQTQLGDLLYKLGRPGEPGHVGIRVRGNLVGENSSTRFGRVHGALGYRYLLKGEAPTTAGWWGPIEVAVRLPAG